jgi:hypothetical protein
MEPLILNNIKVKITISAIKAMWDSRSEKSFYERMNWLDGMDSEYYKVLLILFSNYGKEEETIKVFAKRISEI